MWSLSYASSPQSVFRSLLTPLLWASLSFINVACEGFTEVAPCVTDLQCPPSMSCVVGECKLKAVSVEGDFGVVIEPDQGISEDEGVPEDMTPPPVDFGHPVYAPLDVTCNVLPDEDDGIELDSRRYDDGTLRPSPDTHRVMCFEDELYLFAHDLATEAPDPSEPERPLSELQLYAYQGRGTWAPQCSDFSVSQENLGRLSVGHFSQDQRPSFHLMSYQRPTQRTSSGAFEHYVINTELTCNNIVSLLNPGTLLNSLTVSLLSFAWGNNVSLQLWKSEETPFGEPLSVAYLDLLEIERDKHHLCELEVEDEEGFKTLDSWSLTVGRGWLAWLNILQSPAFEATNTELIDQAPKLTLTLYHAPIKEPLEGGEVPLCEPPTKTYELNKLVFNYISSVPVNPRGLINLSYDSLDDSLAFCVPNIDASCQLTFLRSAEEGGLILWPVVNDEPVRLKTGTRFDVLGRHVAYITYNPQSRADELRILSPCDQAPVGGASEPAPMTRATCYQDELFMSKLKLSEVKLMMLNGNLYVIWIELKASGWVLRSKQLD